MIIIFDTNIWLSELGLNSPLGAATKFFIKQNKAYVALPEVVRLETEHNLRNRLREFIETIRSNHRQLLMIFGKLKEVILPEDDAIEKKVSELFSDIGVDLIEIPFSLESARKSFIKTIDGVPPSAKNNQQFKDGVLWADCVELLKTDDLYLVTNDKDFYRDREQSKGLASNLAEEISAAEHSFRLFFSLVELFQELRTEVTLDEQLLAQTFLYKNRGSIDGILKRNGFEIGQYSEVGYTLYATEKSSRLYVKFNIIYEAKDETDENRRNAILILDGDGSYNADSQTFDELRNFGEKLVFELEDGTKKEIQNYVLFAGGIVLGHKEVEHTVKYKLE
jgi:hypothetical protein